MVPWVGKLLINLITNPSFFFLSLFLMACFHYRSGHRHSCVLQYILCSLLYLGSAFVLYGSGSSPKSSCGSLSGYRIHALSEYGFLNGSCLFDLLVSGLSLTLLVPFPHIILCVYLHNINRKFLKNIKSLSHYGTNGLWHIRYSFGTGTKYTLLYVAANSWSYWWRRRTHNRNPAENWLAPSPRYF